MWIFFLMRQLIFLYLNRKNVFNGNGIPDRSIIVRERDVCIKYEERECYITGIAVLSPGILVVCDNSSSSVKIVDAVRNVIEAYVKVINGPRDITAMGQDHAAVTIPDNGLIQIIKIIRDAGILKCQLDKEINVEGECSGIDFDKGLQMFAVSFTCPVKIELIGEDGTCYRCFRGEDHFERPLYIRFSRNQNKMFFVSDMKSNTLTEVGVDPFVVVYKKGIENVQGARDLYILPNNNILLCGWNSNNICLVSELGSYLDTKLDASYGLEFPCAMSYCETDQKIYVSSKRIEAGPELWGNIKVFRCILDNLCPR